jgi:hypothetical protein
MATDSSTLSPFIYGRPVRHDEFLDRKDELRTICNRLRHTESTAIVGEPHIGKSSLILKLMEEETQQAYLADEADNTISCLLDLHPIGSSYTPIAFWQEVLEPLDELEPSSSKKAPESGLPALLKQARDAGYTRRTLEKLFNHLGEKGRRLALLLDEFERLLIHPNFQDPSFFALMRSLATRTGGLAMITTSRLSVAEMNERGRVLLETGSPFFNHTIEMRLHPFDKVTIGTLLDRAGQAFSPEDRRFIRRVAGRHPFLLQAMAAVLLETSGDDRYEVAAERFYERTSSHFDDLWRTLDDRTRTAAVILSLMELGGRALGDRFAYGEIEQADSFGPELRKLEERGLADMAGEGWQFDIEHLLLWQGEQWTVGTQAFVWWVRDVIITESRRVPAYDEWLANKRYTFLLTQQQWDLLVNTVRDLPQWAVRGVAGLARSLVQELAGRK